MTDNAGNVLAPMLCAPVNEVDLSLLPGSLKLFQQIVAILGLKVKGKELNLDAGFDSKENRKAVWNAGLIPNIAENIRNRNLGKPRRGRPRHFNIKSYKGRFTVERLYAWHDIYRATVIRYSRKQNNFMAHNLLAFTLINLRYFIRRS
jgi:hypothetical protein